MFATTLTASSSAPARNRLSIPLDAVVGQLVRRSAVELSQIDRAAVAARLDRAAQFAIDGRRRRLAREMRAAVLVLAASSSDSRLGDVVRRGMRGRSVPRSRGRDELLLAHVQLGAFAAAFAAGRRGQAAIAANLATILVLGD